MGGLVKDPIRGPVLHATSCSLNIKRLIQVCAPARRSPSLPRHAAGRRLSSCRSQTASRFQLANVKAFFSCVARGFDPAFSHA